MSLIDLNDDVLYLILNHLDINDLVSFAETNEHYFPLAVTVFKHKYSRKIVEIFPRALHSFHDNGERLYIHDIQLFKKVLQQFGRVISKMKVNYPEMGANLLKNRDLVASIFDSYSKSISSYCSDSLVHLILIDFNGYFIKQMIRPFKNVEFVEISGDFETLNSSTLRFNEIFPKIKNLSMPATSIGDIDCIDVHFPHLIEVNVDFVNPYGRNIIFERTIDKLLQKNPQLQILKIRQVNVSFLKAAISALPNLKHLRIEKSPLFDDFFDFGPEITFKHLKKLELLFVIQYFPRNITFEQLEELHVHISAKLGIGCWIDFMENYTHLKKFRISDGCINNNDLQKFTNVDLRCELSIQLCSDVEDENVIRFVVKNPKVIKFHFKFYTFSKVKLELLERKFDNKWIIFNTGDSIELQKYK